MRNLTLITILLTMAVIYSTMTALHAKEFQAVTDPEGKVYIFCYTEANLVTGMKKPYKFITVPKSKNDKQFYIMTPVENTGQCSHLTPPIDHESRITSQGSPFKWVVNRIKTMTYFLK